MADANDKLLDRFRLGVAAVIVLAWLVSVGVSLASDRVHIPATVHLAMLIVAGWLFEPAITKRIRRNGEEA